MPVVSDKCSFSSHGQLSGTMENRESTPPVYWVNHQGGHVIPTYIELNSMSLCRHWAPGTIVIQLPFTMEYQCAKDKYETNLLPMCTSICQKPSVGKSKPPSA